MVQTDRLLFGGSFDPPHRGHLEMLRYILNNNLSQYADLVPAAISPLKQNQPPHGSAIDRLTMLQKLVNVLCQGGLSRERLNLLDLELKREPPSYTADTCQTLRSRYKDSRIAILIGSDSLRNLHRWQRLGELFEHHPFWLFPRPGMTKAELKTLCTQLSCSFPQARFAVLWESPMIPCSSSSLRQLLAKDPWLKQDDCLLPQVLRYIQERHIYQVNE